MFSVYARLDNEVNGCEVNPEHICMNAFYFPGCEIAHGKQVIN